VIETVSHVSARAAELRRDFDRGFAEPVRVDAQVTEELLAIQVGAQPYAIRLSEVAGLFAGKAVTRVPGGHPALRGIAGFRGALLPVYDLRHLLGSADAETPRWLVIAAAAPVALAFETFIGQLRVPRADILPHAAQAVAPGHAREVVRTKDFVGPIMHLPSVLDAIKA
jgi:purine-binding chemotaxis protein CheW